MAFFVIVTFICITEVNAQVDYSDITEYESLVINLRIDGAITSTADSRLSAKLYLFPTNEGQEVLEMEELADPISNVKENLDNIEYSWSSAKNVKFGLTAKVKTQVKGLENKIVSFPPAITEYTEYTKPSENIDSDNKEIIKKANEIVSGKTDTLKAMSALADFVHNYLEYDEGYVSEVKKSSWVLQNKAGVCDEYTNLFIAMARALKIPARYISGVAYSNNKKAFGNHAWAEVYIPTHGWIPFDATYGQYGWVDATHIVLSRTMDTTNSVVYSYQTNADIETLPISIKAEVSEKLDKIELKTEMNIKLLRNNVKAQSYVPLEVEVKNLQSSYLPISVYLTKSPGVYGNNVQSTILSSDERKKFFFIIDTKDDAKEGYGYEATVEAKTSDNNVQSDILLFSKSYSDQMTLSEALSLVESLSISEDKLSYDVSLDCNPLKTEFYTDEEINAECIVKNNGNSLLNSLLLCADGQCREFELTIGEEKKIGFVFGKEKSSYIVTLENNVVSKSDYLGFVILEKPDIKVIDLNPKEIDYNEGNITVTVESKSTCKDVVIKVNNLIIKTDKISLKKDFSIPMIGKNFLSEKADVRIECYDFRDNKYTDKKTFDLEILNVPSYAKIWQVILKIMHPILGYVVKNQ